MIIFEDKNNVERFYLETDEELIMISSYVCGKTNATQFRNYLIKNNGLLPTYVSGIQPFLKNLHRTQLMDKMLNGKKFKNEKIC